MVDIRSSLKYGAVFQRVFDYAIRHGVAYLFYDWEHGKFRARAHGTFLRGATLIGTYDMHADVVDMLADIESFQVEHKLQSRELHKPRMTEFSGGRKVNGHKRKRKTL